MEAHDAVSAEQRNREMFFSVIGPHLKRLYHFVRHQLAYSQAVGKVLPDELTPEEVVDAVVLRAYREFARQPPERRVRSWLVGLAREHLEAEVARLQAWRARTRVRLEGDVPETPPVEEVSTLGDEVLDFYEPEEDLKVEDVLPDLKVRTPEEEVAARELQWCVDAALAAMPSAWRRIVLLRHVGGLAGAELARAVGRPESEVQRTLEHARQYLRQRLVEAGCSVEGSDIP